MKKILSIFLAIQILFLQVSVYADVPRTEYIAKNQPAPFAGTLLNDLAAAKIISEKQKIKDECELQKTYVSLTRDAKCKLKVDLLKIEIDIGERKYNTMMEIKNKEIDNITKIALKHDKPSTKIWWASGGAVAGIAVTIGMFFLVGYVSDNR